MQVTVRFNGVHRGVDLRDLETIMRTAIERVTYRVKQICLYIEDVNGPRGGLDKQCRCVVHLRRLPPVVIRDRDDNLYALVHRVADRAAQTLRRKKDLANSRSVESYGNLLHTEET